MISLSSNHVTDYIFIHHTDFPWSSKLSFFFAINEIIRILIGTTSGECQEAVPEEQSINIDYCQPSKNTSPTIGDYAIQFRTQPNQIRCQTRRSFIKQIRSHPIIRCKPDPSRINSRSQPSRNNETGIHSDLLTYFTISEIIVKADFVPMISSLPSRTERDRIFPTESDFSRMSKAPKFAALPVEKLSANDFRVILFGKPSSPVRPQQCPPSDA
ncbi:hypothetical protein M8J76_014396 [Diaphorina citri]|nr:hypothetical protein M8J76_014396 [Diaphorina citri]